MPTHNRQLAAIMFTDIAGYTALMDTNEELAFELLQKNRSIHKPLIELFHGKFLKEMGDGILASFTTISDAVYCAGAIQKACEKEPDLNLRIGIHQGEIVLQGDDVFGSGVNIASRIEAIAPVGGIWVSDSVQRNIQNKKGIIIEYVKEETLKNVTQPVRIYNIKVDEEYTLISSAICQGSVDLPSNSNKKSIAVLPFVNMSNDPEQDYFCDGLSEELLNVLAQLDKIKVAARTSSFMFKGQNRDITEIGEKLKVNTILEGSVRKSGNRIRITVQLINIEDGFHIWSEKYDREITDIFDIQDEIALAILKELKIKLLGGEKENILRRDTDNTEAYQYYLNGRFNYHKFTGEGWLTGLKYYDKALELVPDYAKALAGRASCHLNLWHFSILPPKESFFEMKEATYRALELNDNIAETHLAMARYKLWHDFDLENAAIQFEKVFKYNANIPDALAHYAFVQNLLGNSELAKKAIDKSKDLDPFSPMVALDKMASSWLSKNYETILEEVATAIEIHPHFWGGYWYLGMYYWSLKDYDNALVNIKKAFDLFPGHFMKSLLGCLYALINERGKAVAIINELEESAKQEVVGSFYFTILYAAMGDMDTTFKYLEKAGQERTGHLIFLDYYARDLIPSFDNDSRYLPLIEKIGIPLRKE